MAGKEGFCEGTLNSSKEGAGAEPVLRSLSIPAPRNTGLRPAPASHFSFSPCHAPVVDWRRAVPTGELTLLILDNSANIGYSCVLRLAGG